MIFAWLGLVNQVRCLIWATPTQFRIQPLPSRQALHICAKVDQTLNPPIYFTRPFSGEIFAS
ncbi:hypothetical protein [Nostoc sp.]